MAVTYLKNCTIIDPASSVVYETGLISLAHRGDEEAPDPIGWCGDIHDQAAPNSTAVGAEDFVLDMEGSTVMPGLIDLDGGLIANCESNSAYGALVGYRRASEAFIRGMLSAGCLTDKQGIAHALQACTGEYLLWGPRIAVLDTIPSREGYCVFGGLPLANTREEETYLKKVRCAKEQGLKPAVATGLASSAFSGTVLPLVEAARLLVQGGFTSLEALQAVTINNAVLMGLSGVTARLEKSYEADIIAVSGNPLEDINALSKIILSARGGRLIQSKLKGFERSRFALLPPGYEL